MLIIMDDYRDDGDDADDDGDDHDDDDEKQVCHLLPMFAPVADATRQRGPVLVFVLAGLCSCSSTFLNFQWVFNFVSEDGNLMLYSYLFLLPSGDYL